MEEGQTFLVRRELHKTFDQDTALLLSPVPAVVPVPGSSPHCVVT